ncbi:MAG: hypothetical protein WDN45_16770 [Caulobacteraceae bacterium]
MSRDAPLSVYEFFAVRRHGPRRPGRGLGLRLRQRLRPPEGQDLPRQLGRRPPGQGDVGAVRPDQLPGRADLAWASLAVPGLQPGRSAGRAAGAARSSAFWGFWRLMEALAAEGARRAPSSSRT